MCFDCLFVVVLWFLFFFFFVKQKTAYEMRISDWSSDVFSSDLDFGLLLVVEEYPAFPHIGGDRHEAAFLLVEIEEVRLVWHAHQAAVVAVDPVVVIAGEARGAAALGQHGSVAK